MVVSAVVTLSVVGAGCKKKQEKGGAGGGGGGAGGGKAPGSGPGTATGGTAGATGAAGACVTRLVSGAGDVTLTTACGAVALEGDVVIDGRLTIEPGVTITAGKDARLTVGDAAAGSLLASGAAEQPITFTSADKQPGAWQGVVLGASNSGSVLRHVVLEFAGRDDGASLSIDGEAATVQDSSFRDGKGFGLRVGGEQRLAAPIQGCSFERLSGGAMRVTGDVLPWLGENRHGDATPIAVGDGNAHRDATLSAGHYLLLGDVGVERTLPEQAPPVLTIPAGTLIESVPGAELAVGYGELGTLRILGTVDKPVRLGAADQKPGGWTGVRLYDGARAVDLQHVIISFAESSASEGAIQVRGAAAGTLDDITFENITGAGVSLPKASAVTASNLHGGKPALLQAKK